ncbi:hypothetical protein K2F40_15555 [Clostridium sp. CM028]|uniref:hypothetical protein n=1 Tax=Clostridium sp. CM028 TaxID=2851575 RepID=UPI001C6E1B6D|nr:hypothetical protein [Clostridium sp. CM028]MBW9150375.1 hypothetical protein [Clostridium sp. CM028]WLC63549.1 hypothetical protein KTC94_17375 [Clostridium sp. CM028]
MSNDTILNDLQLNFINYFLLNDEGIKKELKEIIKIIEFSLKHMDEYPEFQRVLFTQVRLLLCDNDNSLIYKVMENPLLPDYTNNYTDTNSKDKLYFHEMFPLFDFNKEYIELDTWLKKELIYFKRDSTKLPKAFSKEFFEQVRLAIKPKLKRSLLDECYESMDLDNNDENEQMMILKSDLSKEKRNILFETLNVNGYNSISMYDYIKMWGDKASSHIDRQRPIGMMLLKPKANEIHYIKTVAIMLLELFKDI